MLANAPIFANVPAKDFERAKRWYADKLGLNPTMDMPGGGVYSAGGVTFFLYATEFAGTGKHTIATFIVDNIDRKTDELRAKGVVFEEYQMGDKGPNTVNGIDRDTEAGMAVAWFKDSEGNILALTQLPPDLAPEVPRG